MSRVMRTVLALVFFAFVVAVPSIWAFWVQDGMALCTATGDQTFPTIAPDGAGGAIVTWMDYRSGNNDIYVQRVNESGDALWTADGIAICTASGNQTNPTIIFDGAGGAIVTWMDYRSGSGDIYAQRVNDAGAVQWTPDNGVAICIATGAQTSLALISDGAGGAIITWEDNRAVGGFNIFAQRVNDLGAAQWTANGVAICAAADHQLYPQIISDGAGGAIITWQDLRNTYSYNIYAQRVNDLGGAQWAVESIPFLVEILSDRPVITRPVPAYQVLIHA